MLASSLIVALMASAPIASSSHDTLGPQDSVRAEATSAPADSSAGWYRREMIDARLVQRASSSAGADTLPRRRPRAIEYSDWYYRRLQIHKWGSYIELPLFAGEYWLGNKL